MKRLRPIRMCLATSFCALTHRLRTRGLEGLWKTTKNLG